MNDEASTPAAQSAASIDQYREQRIRNLEALQAMGYEPFGQAFERTRLADIRAAYADD